MHIVYTVYWIHKSPGEVGKKARVLPEALSKKKVSVGWEAVPLFAGKNHGR